MTPTVTQNQPIYPPLAASGHAVAFTVLALDRRFGPQYGCGELLRCPDPVELRGILEALARVLPASSTWQTP
jgi:hypothetical protein